MPFQYMLKELAEEVEKLTEILSGDVTVPEEAMSCLTMIRVWIESLSAMECKSVEVYDTLREMGLRNQEMADTMEKMSEHLLQWSSFVLLLDSSVSQTRAEAIPTVMFLEFKKSGLQIREDPFSDQESVTEAEALGITRLTYETDAKVDQIVSILDRVAELVNKLADAGIRIASPSTRVFSLSEHHG